MRRSIPNSSPGNENPADRRCAGEGIDRHPRLVGEVSVVFGLENNRGRGKGRPAVEGSADENDAGREGAIGRALGVQKNFAVQVDPGHRVGGARK